MEYKAVLFAIDGAFVTDFHGKKTKKEVWEAIEDMGSLWIFYPIVAVENDNGRIVDTEDVSNPLQRKTITESSEYVKQNAKVEVG